MTARDQIELRCNELPNALEFTVTRSRGWVSMTLFPAIAFVVLLSLWVTGMLPLRIMAILGAVSCAIAYVTNFTHGNRTTLRLTEDELVVERDFSRLSQKELRIHANELKSLQWEAGGEDASPGLYARWGWRNRCLLADITREQAESIRHSIADKFPKMRVFDTSPVSLLFGNESGITKLGLRETDPGASKPQD